MEFDFVIVGAGSAGCALANRLSADPKYSVALLEAGGRDINPWIHIPVGYFKTMDNPKTDWRYRTESDPGLNGRDIPWPRGRVLGAAARSTACFMFAGKPKISIIGGNWATPAGPGRMFYPISNVPRLGRAMTAAVQSAAKTVRCPSPPPA